MNKIIYSKMDIKQIPTTCTRNHVPLTKCSAATFGGLRLSLKKINDTCRLKLPLKAQYWPLCFACLCFGFHGNEASIVIKRVLFWPQTKASEFSTLQKWSPRNRSVQCSVGNTGSLLIGAKLTLLELASGKVVHQMSQMSQTSLFINVPIFNPVLHFMFAKC